MRLCWHVHWRLLGCCLRVALGQFPGLIFVIVAACQLVPPADIMRWMLLLEFVETAVDDDSQQMGLAVEESHGFTSYAQVCPHVRTAHSLALLSAAQN